MKIEEITYQIEKHQIYSTEYIPQNPKAIMIMIHGFCSYSGVMKRYQEMVANENILLCALDLPYHGRSSGEPKGWIDSFETYLKVCSQYIDRIKSKYQMNESENENKQQLPLFIYGHSMGGLIVSILARRRNDLSGVVGSAPAYEITNVIVHILYYLFLLLLFLFPKLFVPNKYGENEFPTKDVKKMFEDDPLVNSDKTYLKTVLEMEKYGKNERETDIECPFLLIQGTIDESVTMKGAETKAKHLKHAKSKFIIYKDRRHCLYEEYNLEEQLENLIRWINDVINQ